METHVRRDCKSAEFVALVHGGFLEHGLGYEFIDVMITLSEEEGSELTYGVPLSDGKRMPTLSLRPGITSKTADEEMTRANLDL